MNDSKPAIVQKALADLSPKPQTGKEPDATDVSAKPRNRKFNLPAQGPGRMGNDQKALDAFHKEPKHKQREMVENEWAQVAYALSLRAKRFAKGAIAADFGKLYQIVMAGAIAKDKAYPPKEAPVQGNIVFNLFGKLGAEDVRNILQPTKIIEGKATLVTEEKV